MRTGDVPFEIPIMKAKSDVTEQCSVTSLFRLFHSDRFEFFCFLYANIASNKTR